MRNFLAALIVVTCVGYAQQSGGAERKMPPQAQPKTDDHSKTDDPAKKSGPAAAVRRLESVTWDPLQAQLTWVISVWDLDSDMSKPTALERYAIHVDAGFMESGGEQRTFEVPGSDIHALMSIISTYAMRSTIWWEHKGADAEPAPDGSNGTKDKGKGDGRDDKPKAPPSGKAVGVMEELGANRILDPAAVAH